MRAICAAMTALLGVTALACTAPASVAGDNISSFGYNVRPASIRPGGRVTLPVQGCNDTATVYSGVFDTVTVPKGRTSATATVNRDAAPGAVYDVTFRCGREYGHTNLAIASSSGQGDNYGDGSDREGERDSDRQGEGERDSDRQGEGERGSDRQGGGERGSDREGEQPGFRRHGVRAGAGGSIADFDPKKIGLGAALVAGTVGTAWYMSRRRSTAGKS